VTSPQLTQTLANPQSQQQQKTNDPACSRSVNQAFVIPSVLLGGYPSSNACEYTRLWGLSVGSKARHSKVVPDWLEQHKLAGNYTIDRSLAARPPAVRRIAELARQALACTVVGVEPVRKHRPNVPAASKSSAPATVDQRISPCARRTS